MSIATMRHGSATAASLTETGWIEQVIEARAVRARRDVAAHLARYSDDQLKRFGLSGQHIRNLRAGGKPAGRV